MGKCSFLLQTGDLQLPTRPKVGLGDCHSLLRGNIQERTIVFCHTGFLSYSWDIIPDKSSLGNEDLILAYSSKGCSPSWRGSWMTEAGGGWPGCRSREQWVLMQSYGPPLYLVQQLGLVFHSPQLTQSHRHGQRFASKVIIEAVSWKSIKKHHKHTQRPSSSLLFSRSFSLSLSVSIVESSVGCVDSEEQDPVYKPPDSCEVVEPFVFLSPESGSWALCFFPHPKDNLYCWRWHTVRGIPFSPSRRHPPSLWIPALLAFLGVGLS